MKIGLDVMQILIHILQQGCCILTLLLKFWSWVLCVQTATVLSEQHIQPTVNVICLAENVGILIFLQSKKCKKKPQANTEFDHFKITLHLLYIFDFGICFFNSSLVLLWCMRSIYYLFKNHIVKPILWIVLHAIAVEWIITSLILRLRTCITKVYKSQFQ